MLIPHLADFVLFLASRAKGMPFQKYGDVDSEGNIVAPNPYKLKFLLPYYLPMSERRVVLCLYALTAAFGTLGLLVPW